MFNKSLVSGAVASALALFINGQAQAVQVLVDNVDCGGLTDLDITASTVTVTTDVGATEPNGDCVGQTVVSGATPQLPAKISVTPALDPGQSRPINLLTNATIKFNGAGQLQAISATQPPSGKGTLTTLPSVSNPTVTYTAPSPVTTAFTTQFSYTITDVNGFKTGLVEVPVNSGIAIDPVCTAAGQTYNTAAGLVRCMGPRTGGQNAAYYGNNQGIAENAGEIHVWWVDNFTGSSSTASCLNTDTQVKDYSLSIKTADYSMPIGACRAQSAAEYTLRFDDTTGPIPKCIFSVGSRVYLNIKNTAANTGFLYVCGITGG